MTHVASTDLDWREFSAARFPGRPRHDLQALVAYAAYRRSQVAAEPVREEPARALGAWEDEGGSAL